MQVEISHLLQFLGLQIAILAFVGAALYAYVHHYAGRRVENLAKMVSQHRAEESMLRDIVDCVCVALVALDGLTGCHHVITERIAKSDDWSTFMKLSDPHKRRLSKSVQTLILFSERHGWKLSAINQLTEDLGGPDTLRFLEVLRAYDPGYAGLYEKATRDLSLRLDDQLKLQLRVDDGVSGGGV